MNEKKGKKFQDFSIYCKNFGNKNKNNNKMMKIENDDAIEKIRKILL